MSDMMVVVNNFFPSFYCNQKQKKKTIKFKQKNLKTETDMFTTIKRKRHDNDHIGVVAAQQNCKELQMIVATKKKTKKT